MHHLYSGAKLLWWTMNDSDPNISDKTYFVPWTSYYFHVALGCSFVWALHLSRKVLVAEVYDWKKYFHTCLEEYSSLYQLLIDSAANSYAVLSRELLPSGWQSFN